MSSVVLELRITGTAGAYEVFAQLGDDAAEGDLGLLPDNFREQPDALQKSILGTTECIRNRLLTRTKPKALDLFAPKTDNPSSSNGPLQKGRTQFYCGHSRSAGHRSRAIVYPRHFQCGGPGASTISGPCQMSRRFPRSVDTEYGT
jgi:hypothetical protein